jgi:phage terminase small subunit
MDYAANSAKIAAKHQDRRRAGKLLAKQEKWCQIMALGTYSGAEAARLAGYSDKYANATANRLNKDPLVVARLTELMKEAGKRNEVTVDEIIAGLRDARDDAMANGQLGVAVRATELLGKYLGVFSEKVTTTHHFDPTKMVRDPARLRSIAKLSQKKKENSNAN